MGTENDMQTMVRFVRDREFVEKNEKRLGQSVRESILLSDLKVYAIAGGDLLLQINNNGSIELTGKLTSLTGSKDLNISEIFQCDGLMLCSVKSELVETLTLLLLEIKVNDAFLITKFDFTTETLVRLPLPFQNLHPWDKAFLSVVRDEKIALLHVLETERSMRILVTNKIDDDDEAKDLSWRSDMALGIDCYGSNMYFESFLFDEENKVAVLSCAAHLRRKFLTRIYVADEYMYKQVYEAKTSTFDWPRIITYAPSLVHIPKSTPKKRQKRQRLASP
ncbi:hypothetical protein Bca52824_050281 [Brassica carinata]|uniref:F-box associated beta-propeller type 1 domain-containing protein n=1 Tax=Brassica carinata TaxID=52824 RepID=A0A8X7RMK9_BRACI|nr:hypothetical protein Bca52824_050281 [Brassica carinata]